MPVTLEFVEKLMSEKAPDIEGAWDDRDTLLYCVAVGMGRDPMDRNELPFVCETQGDKVLPSAASVLARPLPGQVMTMAGRMGADPKNPDLGFNYTMLLHGEQRLTLHKPLPRQANIIISRSAPKVFDKGQGKGALMVADTTIKDKATGEPIFTSSGTMFYRADGGFGGKAEGAPVPHPIPDRAPDKTVEMPTRVDQAMVYALCGDRNPLHRDPDVAKRAGYDRPILHGLCSYGVCCHAVVKAMCGYDPARLAQFDVRFSAPVFPGETLLVDMWQDGSIVSFRARLKEREVVAINNGKAVLR